MKKAAAEIGRAKCAEKTARGNAFAAKAAAKRAASRRRRQTGRPIAWFRCRFCPCYHLGGVRTAEERRARRLNRGNPPCSPPS